MQYYISLGTNLGDKEQNLLRALQELESRVGEVTSCSTFHATTPWGFESENAFLNAVCCLHTSYSPHQVLSLTQQIERDLGRTTKSIGGIYHDRLIDIDLLLCFDEQGVSLSVDTPDLQIPHPLMHQREFVMIPLHEIAPDF